MEAKKATKQTPIAVHDDDVISSWSCTNVGDKGGAFELNVTEKWGRPNLGVGYYLNTRCCTQDTNTESQVTLLVIKVE